MGVISNTALACLQMFIIDHISAVTRTFWLLTLNLPSSMEQSTCILAADLNCSACILRYSDIDFVPRVWADNMLVRMQISMLGRIFGVITSTFPSMAALLSLSCYKFCSVAGKPCLHAKRLRKKAAVRSPRVISNRINPNS